MSLFLFLANVFVWVYVSVAMSLFLSCFVVPSLRNARCKGSLCFPLQESCLSSCKLRRAGQLQSWPAPLINTCNGKACPVLSCWGGSGLVSRCGSTNTWSEVCCDIRWWDFWLLMQGSWTFGFGLHKKASHFSLESEGRGGDQGESKNAALDLLQDLVVRAHRYKVSGYDRRVLTDDPLAPAVRRWWSHCCEGFVPTF